MGFVRRNHCGGSAVTCRAKAGLCLAVLATSFACGKNTAADSGDNASPVPEVTVAKVQRGPLAEELIVSGNLAAMPNRDAKVAALVPGKIAKMLVREGDVVQVGQVLAELDATSLQEQERQSQAAEAQAKANLENARLSAERNEGLLQRGIAARKEVEDARTQLSVNQAAVQQAEAALAAARTQLSRALIRAPFAGTVVHRFLSIGEQVDGSGAQPVVEVADISALELLGTVPAARLNEIKTGEQFSFQTTSVPGATFTGRVAAVLPAVDPATNNGTARIRIDNPKHQLKLGMFLSVALPVTQPGKALLVPKQAVYPDESGEPHVYLVSGDQAEFTAVRLGIQTQDKAQILSGVQEGDTVIVSGGYGLPQKARVRVKPK